MHNGRDERIRQKAYEIWEREGRPEGREAQHWQQAAAEVDRENPAADPADAGQPDITASPAGLSSPLQPGATKPGGGPGRSKAERPNAVASNNRRSKKKDGNA